MTTSNHPDEHLRPSGHPDCADADAALRASWGAFAGEMEELLAVDPDDMTPEQLARLDRLSDPLIDLYGWYQRSQLDSAVYTDPRLVAYLAEQDRETRARRRRGRRKSAAEGLLSEGEIRALSRRILGTLQAERLGVREVNGVPIVKRALGACRIDAGLLTEAERRHEAIVPELPIAAGAGRELWDGECEGTVELPSDLARGRYVALKVSGDSMEPLMHSGDTVLVKLDARPSPGSVVVARDPDHGYVVKEVGGMTPRGIELLSLNSEFPPLRIPHGVGAILGAVLLRWCPHSPPGTAPARV
jgi:SOS-response transcriptional repressor LexA